MKTPDHFIIQHLGSSHFDIFVDWADSDDNHINTVHLSRFTMPNGDKIEAYAKHYNAQTDGRGIVNEITGYLTAHALGISQPKRAFIAHIPLKRLDIKSNKKAKWLADVKKSQPTYLAFCTQRIDGKGAGYRVPVIDMPMIAQDVGSWSQFADTVALDENIAHVDRHYNNLIRFGKNDFSLIDNGMLAVDRAISRNWTTADLSSSALYENRLLANTQRLAPSIVIDNKSNFVKKSSRHGSALNDIMPELEFWWQTLLTPTDYAAFRHFFVERTQNLESIVRKRHDLLL